MAENKNYPLHPEKRFDIAPDAYSRERLKMLSGMYKELHATFPTVAISLAGSLSKGKRLPTPESAQDADIDFSLIIKPEDFYQNVGSFVKKHRNIEGTPTQEALLKSMKMSIDPEYYQDINFIQPRRSDPQWAIMARYVLDVFKRTPNVGDLRLQGFTFELVDPEQLSLGLVELFRGDPEYFSHWPLFTVARDLFHLDVGGGLREYRKTFLQTLAQQPKQERDAIWQALASIVELHERDSTRPMPQTDSGKGQWSEKVSGKLRKQYPQTFNEAIRYYIGSPKREPHKKVLEPHGLSTSGFLGKGEKFKEVIARDKQILARLGISYETIADRLSYFFQQVGRSGEISVDAKYRVKDFSTLGYQGCPWEDGEQTDTHILVENTSTKRSIKSSGLIPHLIEKHRFFEGKGTSWRLDPLEAVAVLGIDSPKLSSGEIEEALYSQVVNDLGSSYGDAREHAAELLPWFIERVDLPHRAIDFIASLKRIRAESDKHDFSWEFNNYVNSLMKLGRALGYKSMELNDAIRGLQEICDEETDILGYRKRDILKYGEEAENALNK